jgi:hypothetical protein
MSTDVDYLIDRFVDAVNTGIREPVDPENTPPSVFVGEPNEYDNYDWRIKPLAAIDWIEPLEERLGFRIPAVYRSLIARYVFPAFEFGDVFFFGNMPEGTAHYEFRERLFLDECMSAKLLAAGYLQFANPCETNYDPVCCDMNRANEADAPIVQIDHEGMLCNDEVVVVCEVAPSLRALIQTAYAA